MFTRVEEVEDASLEMSESGYTLHFDSVHVFEGMVEDTRCIDYLPSEVLVIKMPNEERLGSESIRLNIHIRASYLIQERGLPDVRVSA